MLRDNLVELIEPMLNSAGADPLALYIHTRTPASDDRLPCLKNPRPEGAESSLTESASSPFQAEPAQTERRSPFNSHSSKCWNETCSRCHRAPKSLVAFNSHSSKCWNETALKTLKTNHF